MKNTHDKLQGFISCISLQGFRSFSDIQNLNLSALNVLIGSNGAGKSNFIRFFDMLGWMMNGAKLQEFILAQGGGDDQLHFGVRTTPRINAEIRIETQAGYNDYRFGLAHINAGDKLMFVDEAYRYTDKKRGTKAAWIDLPVPGLESALLSYASNSTEIENKDHKTARVIVHLLKRCRTYQFHDTSKNARIHQQWDCTDVNELLFDGANLAPILLRLKESDFSRYQQITQQIQRVLPVFKDFDLQPSYGKVLLRWHGQFSPKTFGSHLTSDGSLRLFCLITLLNLPLNMLPDVLFFDEPELGLHPHAITLVAEMLKRLSLTKQVFVATQSPYMVDCFSLENIVVADIKNGVTSLRNLAPEQYQQWLDDDYLLSDIWLNDIAGAAQ